VNYPSSIEQKIGFDTIRTYIENYCKSDIGKQVVASMQFTDSYIEITNSMNQIAEMKHILEFEQDFPTPSFIHISHSLNAIKPLETFMQASEFHTLRTSLREIATSVLFFTKHAEIYPALFALSEHIQIPLDICKHIDKTIDASGNIRDNASKHLIEIRQTMQQKKISVAKIMNHKMRIARTEGWCDSDSELTLRNGRAVIPMNTAYKRKIQGFVHDESITGKTSYVEPVEAFEINNEIISLEYEEQKELIKILKELTSIVRPFIPDIQISYEWLAHIDAISAKARFALRINAQKPNIQASPHISLLGAKHPLLCISFEASKREVVPLKVHLDSKQRILVISGPNAGGKSVCLKTIVLLQYMCQCGLLVSADEQSTLGIFSSICIDIGDEQSLENDLSTYSSHLRNMKHFVQYASPHTLFAIDEFGTGTEPLMGGAIAESVLEQLHNSGAYGIITTHYTNLKHATTSLTNAVNGAMLFDLEQLKPLYKLRMGSAGSSFAFEIAGEIGLPQSIIDNAKQKLGKDHVDFDKNLKKLEEEKQYIFKKREELKKRELEIKQLQENLSEKTQKIAEKKLEIIAQTKQEMQDLYTTANKQIEQTIRTIKESQAQSIATKQARKTLQEFENSSNQHVEQKTKRILQETRTKQHAHTKEIKKLSIGDYVVMKGQQTVGQIVQIKNKQATVQYSHTSLTMSIDTLVPANKPKQQTQTVVIKQSTKTISEKRLHFSPKLDVRGKRSDEALYEVKDFVETAHMLQVFTLEILHGKGYGILRKLIRDYLLTTGFVESCTDAPIDMGGDGITIVKLI